MRSPAEFQYTGPVLLNRRPRDTAFHLHVNGSPGVGNLTVSDKLLDTQCGVTWVFHGLAVLLSRREEPRQSITRKSPRALAQLSSLHCELEEKLRRATGGDQVRGNAMLANEKILRGDTEKRRIYSSSTRNSR